MDVTDAPLNVALVSAAIRDRTDAGLPKVKHSRFWFEDGNVVFLVEGVLYKVHRYFFLRDSARFEYLITKSIATKWLPPLSPGWVQYRGADGKPVYVNAVSKQTSVERPPCLESVDFGIPGEQAVALDDVTAKQFDAFLSVLYPFNFDSGDLSSQQDWVSVLELATRWDFTSIRLRAIRAIDPTIDAFGRLKLARLCRVEEWVQPALVELCMRKSPLGLSEIKEMDHEDVALVMHIKETVQTVLRPWLATCMNIDTLVRKWNPKDGLEAVVQAVISMNSSPPPPQETVAKSSKTSSATGNPLVAISPAPVAFGSQPLRNMTNVGFSPQSVPPQATEPRTTASLSIPKSSAQDPIPNTSPSTSKRPWSDFQGFITPEIEVSSCSLATPLIDLTSAQARSTDEANVAGSPISSTFPPTSIPFSPFTFDVNTAPSQSIPLSVSQHHREKSLSSSPSASRLSTASLPKSLATRPTKPLPKTTLESKGDGPVPPFGQMDDAPA
ncbi:hypothetical protein OF83DRAFT_1174040 [Amylostereum chailletii]|nr:hypothetical protein OF83DRAFT_1174040 [Amylostereum chailletii]